MEHGSMVPGWPTGARLSGRQQRAEPEPKAAGVDAIADVAWIDLRDESGWDPRMAADPWRSPLLTRLRAALRTG